MALKGKLSRLKSHMGLKEEGRKPTSDLENVEISPVEKRIPFQEEWCALGAKPLWFENEYTIVREVTYPLTAFHGRYALGEVKQQVQKWQEHLYEHPLSAKGTHASELLFFDTETTGLSSGAGNTIFLLGYSQIRDDEAVVRQYFLPGPEGEVALYHHFLQDVGHMSDLVTYNGKAFDWPQVKTRHTFVREQVPKLPKFGHYDLLHASRRLWKDLLPSCKLSVVEKEILFYERQEDTPGYLAPMLYFDFLQEQDPAYVEGVLKHNEWDVLSLITLYAHLSALILEIDERTLHPREHFELARWYELLGELELSKRLYEQMSAQDLNLYRESQLARGRLEKKLGNYQQAIFLFTELVEQDVFVLEAGVELAKLFEHKEKDPEKALAYAKQAYQSLGNTGRLLRQMDQREKKELEKRMERLQRKSLANN
ncbi:ribonuclease H-like domain-containing protein [Halalkalibacterium ligniniphilum]|uniref:ribonuclease H-like domain-containing protein n=2 Tax=Halalkalibacterium ligniniphilum TaxID=1134413 RepID=UPI00034BA58C|nr:ribonuclease H-like domain-containing protein [Halalkalibacterium ligniniphilum]